MFKEKLICNLKTNRIYTSCEHAAKDLGCSTATIYYHLIGRFKGSYAAKQYPIKLISANRIRFRIAK